MSLAAVPTGLLSLTLHTALPPPPAAQVTRRGVLFQVEYSIPCPRRAWSPESSVPSVAQPHRKAPAVSPGPDCHGASDPPPVSHRFHAPPLFGSDGRPAATHRAQENNLLALSVGQWRPIKGRHPATATCLGKVPGASVSPALWGAPPVISLQLLSDQPQRLKG